MKDSGVDVRVVQGLLLGALAAVVLAAATGCGGGTDGEPAPPPVPTTVFGRQARDLAVGIAAQRRGQKVSIRTTVFAQDGTPKRGLDIAVRGAGGWEPSSACGAGRYCGEVAVDSPRPRLRVRLTRPAGGVSTLSMTLPRNPQTRRATALVRATGAAFLALRSVIIDEVLASGPPYAPLLTQFSYVAPDRLNYRIAGAGQAVVIGSNRWDRQNAN